MASRQRAEQSNSCTLQHTDAALAEGADFLVQAWRQVVEVCPDKTMTPQIS